VGAQTVGDQVEDRAEEGPVVLVVEPAVGRRVDHL
jgi:hypothetical protein